MSEPNGTLARVDDDELALSVTRTFDASIESVWASVTESDQTAAWIGPWTGTARIGSIIELTMVQEDGDPVVDARIDACDEPFHVAFTMPNPDGDWSLELRLAEGDGVTELTLTQFLGEPALAESYGPGWEFYLDCLVAARAGSDLPVFTDYYPAMGPYYEELADALI